MEFDKSLMLDILYGYEPMTRSLAIALKDLRCVKQFPFEEIPPALNHGFGTDFALGKELCSRARIFLNDNDKKWD
jgi:hypothetical protein